MESKEIPKKKNVDKKNAKESKRKELSPERKTSLINVALLLALVLIVSLGTLVIYLNSVPAKDDASNVMKKLYELNYKVFPKPVMLAAVVNDKEITVVELERRYGMLPVEYQPYITKADLLEQIIDENVLLGEAAKEKIVVSDSDVESYLLNLSNASGVSMDEFANLLKQKGLEINEAKDYYKRSLILNALLENTVLKQAEVSNVDIEDYYNKNPEMFIVPQSANISHILICYNESLRCPSNFTKDGALKEAIRVRKLVTENNFEELALKYSQEPAAQLTKGSLGWVNMEIPFDKNFLNETFKLKSGELSQPIETVFGYHLIKVWEKRPEEKLDLESVKEQITQTLTSQKQSDLYFAYVSGLRNTSNIIVYYK